MKGDNVKRYCFILKRILECDDQNIEIRCKNAVNVWVKILNRHSQNSSFFPDTTFDLLWTWFLKMAGGSKIFRNEIVSKKLLLTFLLDKSFANQGFIKM